MKADFRRNLPTVALVENFTARGVARPKNIVSLKLVSPPLFASSLLVIS